MGTPLALKIDVGPRDASSAAHYIGLSAMQTIGLIGAGRIGSQIARLGVAHGFNVVISNSRGPEPLADLVADVIDTNNYYPQREWTYPRARQRVDDDGGASPSPSTEIEGGQGV